MITEQLLLETRDEIIARSDANDRLFNKLYSKVSDRHKAEHKDLENQFIDFCYNNVYYKPKDVNAFFRQLYEIGVLEYLD